MSNEIKDYQVITTQGAENINRLVRAAIANGWTPLGGISSAFFELKQGTQVVAGYQFSQALIK